MSWGDAWVCGAEVPPTIDGDGPPPPWILAGTIARDERAFIEAIQRMQSTRGGHARKVEFFLQVHNRDVALTRNGAKPASVAFEPDGLWVAVDITADGNTDGPRFVVFTQRVQAATLTRRASAPQPGVKRRPLAVLPLRARARSGASALAWGYRAPSL